MAKAQTNFTADLARLDEIQDQREALDTEESSIKRRLVETAGIKEHRERMTLMVRAARRVSDLLGFVKE